MGAIEKRQIGTIYGIARNLGIDNDNLHVLVGCQTGKDSIRALSFVEAETVIADLKQRQKAAGLRAPSPRRAPRRVETPGGVTGDQQAKVWALMYEWEKWEPAEAGATLGSRLCGLINRQFKMDTSPQQPFRFLKMHQGSQLIEALKEITEKAELKAIHRGGVRHG